MKFARKLNQISVSQTIAVMQEAQRLKSQGVDVIDLGPGQPDFQTPDFIRESGVRAIEQGFTKYTAAAGFAELRQAVADRYNRDFGSRFGLENVIITSGAKTAISHACTTMFDEGQKVLIPAPYWVTFPEVVKLAGATPIFFETLEENGFEIVVDDVRERISETVRGLIINSPNNPTGAVLPESVMADLAELARKEDLFVISDETYDRFTYNGRDHSSLAAFVEPTDECFGITGSFSKTYAMTGWRIGYLIAHPECIRKVSAYQSHQCGNPCSISQKAALAALEGPDDVVKAMLSEYSRRRQFVLETLNRIPGVSCPVPHGAFYAFPNVEECFEKVGVSGSIDFSRYLISEARVATVPGAAFGMEGYIRLSYATSMDNLRDGLSRIDKAVRGLSVA